MRRLASAVPIELNVLTIWFADPAEESICEETADEVVLMKDRRGHVIGLEVLGYETKGAGGLAVEKIHIF